MSLCLVKSVAFHWKLVSISWFFNFFDIFMKKILNTCSDWIIPFTLLTSLVPVMMYQSGGNFISQWITLCLLWGGALWNARNLSDYYLILKDKAFLVYFLFIVWAFFNSLYWSTARAVSLISVFTFFGGLLTYFIGYTSNNKSARHFYLLLLVFGSLLCFYTYYQSFILHIARPAGMLGNWNTHAALLALIILPTIILKSLTEKISILAVSGLAMLVGLFAFAISLTLSRGVLIIFAVAILCSVILAWRKKLFFKQGLVFLVALVMGYVLQGFLVVESVISRIGGNAESRGVFIIFVCVILYSVIIVWRKKLYFKQIAIFLVISVVGYLLQGFLVGESVIPRLSVDADVTASSLTAIGSGRHLLWQPAWEMFLDRPFLGWGLGVFYLIYPQYKAPLTKESGFFAHNDYLQVLLELGPIGLIFLVVFVFIITKRLWQLMFSPGVFSEFRVEAFALLVVCVGLLVHTFFTFHLYQLTIQIIFGFYLGRAAKISYGEHNIPVVSIAPAIGRRFKSVYISAIVFIVLSSGLLGVSYYNLNKATESKNLAQSLKYYRKAGELLPTLNSYEFFSAVDLFNQLKNTRSLEKKNELKALALQWIEIAIEKREIDAKNYVLKAKILQVTRGDFREVSALYEHALKLAPGMFKVRYGYAKYLLDYRRNQQALSVLWAGWERLNLGRYQDGIVYLSYHLSLNQQIGHEKDNAVIKKEIQRLAGLKRFSSKGTYVLSKAD